MDEFSTNSSVDYLYNYEEIRFQGQLKTTPPWETTIKITFTVVLMLASLIGNFLIIFVVLRNKLMRTTTNFYIVNLAVSDLLVTTCCTWVHLVDDLTEGFVLGNFFCKFNSFLQVVVLVSSVLTLMLIACDRFFGVVFAIRAHMTDRRASVFLVLVWLVAVGLACPLLFYRKTLSRQWEDHLEVWCADNWPEVIAEDGIRRTIVGKTAYFAIICFCLFFIPIIVMVFAYIMVIRKLWLSKSPGERIVRESYTQNKVKKKIVAMLIIILIMFILCWLPLQISIIYQEFRQNKTLPDWFESFTYYATFVAYSNSAFNPIIYAGFNENFRKGIRQSPDDRRPSATMTTRINCGKNRLSYPEIHI